jgi:hypothetical protein
MVWIFGDEKGTGEEQIQATKDAGRGVTEGNVIKGEIVTFFIMLTIFLKRRFLLHNGEKSIP